MSVTTHRREISARAAFQPLTLNQELVMTSPLPDTNQLALTIPEELGDDFYLSVTREEESPTLYLLQVGEIASECREVIPSGSFQVEWKVVPDQAYQIEYSTDLLNWVLIPEVVSSSNTFLQWTDAGPPRTESAPGVDRNNRYYRLVIPGE